MKQRIGIFGGTFNPIHVGHLVAAQAVQEKLNLDQVIFIPVFSPPHKSSSGIAAPVHRLNMVRLAVRGNPRFIVSNCEVRREGKSYTIDTVLHLQQVLPSGTKLFVIVGGDMLTGLKQWKHIDELQRRVTFVSVNRPGFLAKKSGIRTVCVAVPGLDISSSDVRRRISAKKSIAYLVPESTARYIRKHKLYK